MTPQEMESFQRSNSPGLLMNWLSQRIPAGYYCSINGKVLTLGQYSNLVGWGVPAVIFEGSEGLDVSLKKSTVWE